MSVEKMCEFIIKMTKLVEEGDYGDQLGEFCLTYVAGMVSEDEYAIDAENKVFSSLTSTVSGKLAVISVEYDITEFSNICLNHGVDEIAPGAFLLFHKQEDNPELSEGIH